MFKYNDKELARQTALSEGKLYGWSVLSGAYYVGSDVQLADIGVILRLRPDDESILTDA